MNRRSVLTSALLAIAARRLPLPNWIGAAHAEMQDKNWRHGLSLYGDLKYPPGFKHFEYVNASAPKSGTARQIAIGTFDNFNTAVAGVKGSLAGGVDLIYESLLVSSLDEVSSEYCLLAEAVSFPADFSSVSYRLRPHASRRTLRAVPTPTRSRAEARAGDRRDGRARAGS